MSEWLLYGATGFTGKLILAEALLKGHRPIVAGRSAEKVEALAKEYGLESRVFDLDKGAAAIDAGLRGVKAVLHAAGPFVHTHFPMAAACLRNRVHYLDITGETPVFQNSYSLHDQAAAKGVTLMPGVGFDVVPADCLANFIIEELPDAIELDLGVQMLGKPSAGTLKTVLELLPRQKNMHFRQGKPVEIALGSLSQNLPFGGKMRSAFSMSLADQFAIQRSTHIPNITSFLAIPQGRIKQIKFWLPVIQGFMAADPLRKLAQFVVEKRTEGPDAELQQNGRSYVSVVARNAAGKSLTACLETVEGYRFTAEAAVLCLEKTIAANRGGAFSPAQAFGANLVMEVETTRRFIWQSS